MDGPKKEPLFGTWEKLFGTTFPPKIGEWIPHHSKWIPHPPKWIPHLPKWIPQPCEPTPGPRLDPAAARWNPGGIKNPSFAATQDYARAPLPAGSDSLSCEIANLFLKIIDFEKKITAKKTWSRWYSACPLKEGTPNHQEHQTRARI